MLLLVAAVQAQALYQILSRSQEKPCAEAPLCNCCSHGGLGRKSTSRFGRCGTQVVMPIEITWSLIKGALPFMYLQRYLESTGVISNDGLFSLPRLDQRSLINCVVLETVLLFNHKYLACNLVLICKVSSIYKINSPFFICIIYRVVFCILRLNLDLSVLFEVIPHWNKGAHWIYSRYIVSATIPSHLFSQVLTQKH